MRVAIIGGGIAGLAAARDLAAAGASVTVYERAPRMGGQAASFEVEPGREIERYYHFICRGDDGYLRMLDELGIADRLRWRTTAMGLFHRGELHTLGDPLSLLRFPYLGARDKLRFAITTMSARFRSADSWRDIEDVTARDWLTRHYGPRTYALLFEPLLRSKFQRYADDVSAAWMWARLHRLGNSRSRLMKERIGYLEGGSQTYVDALEKAARDRGVTLSPRTAVDAIVVRDGRVRAVTIDGRTHECDAVLSTVPVPHTSALFGALAGEYFDNLRSLRYLGVVVVVLRLRRSLSKYYWTNVSDPGLPMSGIIEATNLNPMPALGGDAMVYVPQYVSPDDPRFTMADDELVRRYCDALRVVNPAFERSWVRQWWVHRERATQPLCERGFSAHVPSIRTPVRGLYVTDSYQLNPHDRAISFSTDLGREAARLVVEDS